MRVDSMRLDSLSTHMWNARSTGSNTARFLIGIAIIACAACASATARSEPLVTDRPDFTESTITVAPRAVQAEGGYTFTRAETDKWNAIGELLLRIGIARRAELRIEPGSYVRETTSDGTLTGREDADVGGKLRLYIAPDDHPSPVPAVSLEFATSVPTGTDGLREVRTQPRVALAGEWTLTERVELATNFDVARPIDDARRYTQFAASASFGFDLTPKLGAYAELYGFVPELEGAKRTGYLDTGITALLAPTLQIDFRAGVGLNGPGPDYFVGAGIARRW